VDAAIESLRPALLAAAAELQLTSPDAQLDALLSYLALLRRWNATYNLTSIRDPAQMLTQHLVDCLAMIGPLRRERGNSAQRLLDVGSGGGLPGIVIAILNPEVDVTCVDTVGKKAAFIQQAAAELRLRNLRAQHARVEQLKLAPFDVVTSRAFASLVDFTGLTRQHVAEGGCWMAMKGKRPEDELAQLPADVDVFHVEQLAVPDLDAERCLVWMRPKR
jgi:16S rRNA (guanine527-N7)-methyltransferase